MDRLAPSRQGDLILKTLNPVPQPACFQRPPPSARPVLDSNDGLHNSVSEKDIVDVLNSSQDLVTAVHELVSLANARDGRDNITLQLIRVRHVERVGMYRGRPYKIYQNLPIE